MDSTGTADRNPMATGQPAVAKAMADLQLLWVGFSSAVTSSSHAEALSPRLRYRMALSLKRSHCLGDARFRS